MNDLYLAHHGVKGMKWGVRRSQNSSTESKSKKRKTNKEPSKLSKKLASTPKYGTFDNAVYTANNKLKGERVARQLGKTAIYVAKKRNPNLKLTQSNYDKLIRQAERAGGDVGVAASRATTAAGYLARRNSF